MSADNSYNIKIKQRFSIHKSHHVGPPEFNDITLILILIQFIINGGGVPTATGSAFFCKHVVG